MQKSTLRRYHVFLNFLYNKLEDEQVHKILVVASANLLLPLHFGIFVQQPL